MALQAPFKRTVRPFIDREYTSAEKMNFIRAQSYSEDPRFYIRGFITLQREIRSLFEFIHPDDQNLETYSEHIGVLLVRTCFQVESNLSAILRENEYIKTRNLNMVDYRKIDSSHKLSNYEVLLPEWHGTKNKIIPFKSWSSETPLSWYQAYNQFKHDQVTNIKKAKFGNLIDAWCGLLVILSSQFFLEEFSADKKTLGFADHLPPDEFWHGIGGYLKVKFPTNWLDSEKYDFTITEENFLNREFAKNFPY